MSVFLIKLIQVILSLTILVVIHELGHFIFARLFGVRVERFSLFFGKPILRYKPKRSETEYVVGWLPFGGYVELSGMIDESLNLEQMKQPPQPWEFRTKPAWQRLIIMVGGVCFNLIFACFIYAMILFKWGDSYIPLEGSRYGMEFNASTYSEMVQFYISGAKENFSKAAEILDSPEEVALSEGAPVSAAAGENG